MPPKRPRVDPLLPAARRAARARLGRLRDQRVRPATLVRYYRASTAFLWWLHATGWVLESSWEGLDFQLSEYLEALWELGGSRGDAGDILSAATHMLRTTRRFPGAWGLLRVWQRAELPRRAPPIPEGVLTALVEAALQRHEGLFAALLLVGFCAFLRTGELLSLRRWQIRFDEAAATAVIILPLSKSGQRRGHQEMIVLREQPCVRLLAFLLRDLEPAQCIWNASFLAFRQRFQVAVQQIGCENLQLRPYSLRRGGATSFFQRTGLFDATMERGRWSARSTARIYITEGVAALSEMALSAIAAQQVALLVSAFVSRTSAF